MYLTSGLNSIFDSFVRTTQDLTKNLEEMTAAVGSCKTVVLSGLDLSRIWCPMQTRLSSDDDPSARAPEDIGRRKSVW